MLQLILQHRQWRRKIKKFFVKKAERENFSPLSSTTVSDENSATGSG